MNSFMSSIKSAASGAVGDDKTTNKDQPSNTDLLSSAKLVAEAAQSAANNKSDQIDKPKVAGAAGDLLDSVKQYGKFNESQGVGQYIKQADDYLHQYEKSSGVAATTAAATPLAEAPLSAEAPLEGKKTEVPLSVEKEKTEVPLPVVEEKKADDYLHQYEKSSGVVDATAAATPLAEAPLSAETPLEGKKTEVPLSVEEEKTEVPLPVVEEKKAEVPAPVEEEKVEVPPTVEKGGFESAVGAGDALKAAGSFFK